MATGGQLVRNLITVPVPGIRSITDILNHLHRAHNLTVNGKGFPEK